MSSKDDSAKIVIDPFEYTYNDCVHMGAVLQAGSVVFREISSQGHVGCSQEKAVDIAGYPSCALFVNCVFTKAGAATCSRYRPLGTMP